MYFEPQNFSFGQFFSPSTLLHCFVALFQNCICNTTTSHLQPQKESVPEILLYYCKHGILSSVSTFCIRLQGGVTVLNEQAMNSLCFLQVHVKVAASGVCFHVLCTLMETSIPSVNVGMTDSTVATFIQNHLQCVWSTILTFMPNAVTPICSL